MLCFLSYLEHFRTVRPSTIIETYIFFSIAMDAVQTRTLWLQQDTVLASVASASIAIKVAVLVLESIGKTKLLKGFRAELSPEVTSGVFSRSTFFWLSGLFRVAFASIITLDDLPALDTRLLPGMLDRRMQSSWDRSLRTSFEIFFRVLTRLLSKSLEEICVTSGNFPLLLGPFPGSSSTKTSSHRIQLLATVLDHPRNRLCRTTRR